MEKSYIVVVFYDDAGVETYGSFDAPWKATEFAETAVDHIDVVRAVVSEIGHPSLF